MKATKTLIKISNNYYFPVTKDIAELLQVSDDDRDITWQDEKGKHGPFISFWKKEKETKEE